MITEWNPLVLDGQCERVYVIELEPGDVTPFGEVVESVIRRGDNSTTVYMKDGSVQHYGKGTSTVLIATHH